MNRDFVDTGSTVVPAEDQLLNPTLLLKSPQDAGQNDFANGKPKPSEGNIELPLQEKLGESDQDPGIKEEPTAQIVLVQPALPSNRIADEKLEKVHELQSEITTLPQNHEMSMKAAPDSNDLVPNVARIGEPELDVVKGSIVAKHEDNAFVPPAPLVGVLQPENKVVVSKETHEPEESAVRLAQELDIGVSNHTPVAEIGNLEQAVNENSVAVVGKNNRQVENSIYMAELTQALPEQFQVLLVDDARLTEKVLPGQFSVFEMPEKEDSKCASIGENEADSKSQLPASADNIDGVVQAIAEVKIADHVVEDSVQHQVVNKLENAANIVEEAQVVAEVETDQQMVADDVENDSRDPVSPAPIVLPDEARAEDHPFVMDSNWCPSYIPFIDPDGIYLRSHVENAVRYKYLDKKDYEVDIFTLGFNTLDSEVDFRFNLNSRLNLNIQKLGIYQVRPVQSCLIPTILARRNAVVQTETGSGKTLAYAIPVVERAIREGRTHFGRGPLAVIMVPTRETCYQIAKLLLALSSGTDVKIVFSYGGTNFGTARNAIRNGCDVLVATSARFLQHLKQRHIVVSDLQLVVVDGAEQMIGDTQTRSIILDLLDLRPNRHDFQVVLMATTYDTRITSLYCRRLEPIVDIYSGRYLNKRVKVTTVEIESWHEGVRSIARMFTDPTLRQFIVFVADKDHCSNIHNLLIKKKELEQYAEQICFITSSAPQDTRDNTIEAFWFRRFKCLITTDTFAFGLDFPGVNRIVSLDIPSTPDLLTHRCGRTGRVTDGEAVVIFINRTTDRKEKAKTLQTFLYRENKEIPDWLESI